MAKHETVFELGFRHGTEGRDELTNRQVEELLTRFGRRGLFEDVSAYLNGASDGRRGDTFRLDRQNRPNQSGVSSS